MEFPAAEEIQNAPIRILQVFPKRLIEKNLKRIRDLRNDKTYETAGVIGSQNDDKSDW